MIIRRPSLKFSSLVILASLVVMLTFAQRDKAYAAPVTGFTPGYIISDNIFTNAQSMNVGQIQQFLNSKVSSCDTAGTQPATDFGRSDLTHAQYAATPIPGVKGVWSPPPYTCLKDYSENALSAAQIIYNAAQTYQINPQVLIVLLQKEQGLVTDTWPLATQYRSATGYGCPDTSGCDSSYYGFTNQVKWAATMYHAIMTASPTWYTPYIVGNNYIQYNPNASCGGTTVNIINRATQALYNYTPYQPNQSALNAGYGNGDSCGAYGNRNFYLYFSDWFGSPQYGNLVRTVDDSSVYLVSGDNKYPISDISILGALYPLGGVTFVNQSYLDSKTTGSILGRVIKSSDGTIYFYDAGIKLPFSSCTQVEAYGSSCAQAQLLEDSQIRALFNGPAITDLFGTTSGKQFYISGGEKHEVYDNASLIQAGVSDGANVLNEAAISYLPYGSPVVRKDTLIVNRQDASKQLLNTDTQAYQIKTSQYTTSTFSPLVSKQLDNQSINKLPISTSVIDDSIIDEQGNTYVLTSNGKKSVPNTASFQVSPVQLPAILISQLGGSGALSNPSLLKTSDNGTVYVIVNGQKRPLVAMEDLKSITGEDNPYIGWMSGGLLSSMPTGNIIVGAGRMVKTPSNGTVYVTDGYDRLIPMSSFGPTGDMGITSTIRTISDNILSKYTVDIDILTSYVSCSGINYLGMNGVMYQLTVPSASARIIQPQTCNVLQKSTTPPRFILTPNGTISELESGVLHPISGWSTYIALSAAGGSTVSVSYSTILLFPVGSTI